MQTLALQLTDDTTGSQPVLALTRIRTDLTKILRIDALVDSSGACVANTTASDPSSTVSPCLLFHNYSDLSASPQIVTISFKAVHAVGTVISVPVPAGENLYLPSIDYTTGITMSTPSGTTAQCVALFGYA